MAELFNKGDVYNNLRRLAAQNPREARTWFCQLLDSNSPKLEEILRGAAGLGEGRVRQLLANAVRPRPDKDRLIPHLLKWLETETDEFAKAAIVAVLNTVDISSYCQKPEPTIADLKLVEAYRYLKDRLCHELRNALLRPQTHILQLRAKFDTISDDVLRAELRTSLGQLSDALKRVGRIVELDADDHYFKLRPISICSWLKIMNDEYGKKYQPVSMSIEDNSNSIPIQVLASDHLLYTIFWNLWINSQQAVDGGCNITVSVTANANEVNLLIVDNGNGFSQELREVAFQERYSDKGAHRGRGLLEVQDAIQQLRGKAQLVQYRPGDFRVMLSFPQEAT
jgi:signal transduction histidine kinase